MDKIEKFDDFSKKRDDNFNKTDSYKPMSDDIVALSKDDNGEYKEIKGKVDIIQVMGIVSDDEVKEIEKSLKENIVLDTSMTITNVKRGQELWITAMLKKLFVNCSSVLIILYK